MAYAAKISYVLRSSIPQTGDLGEIFFTTDTNELFITNQNRKVIAVQAGYAALPLVPKIASFAGSNVPNVAVGQIIINPDYGSGYVGAGFGRFPTELG
jgi:hypothetical protein